jgi:hypothetical protein
MTDALYQSLWMLTQVFANLANDSFFSEMQRNFQDTERALGRIEGKLDANA